MMLEEDVDGFGIPREESRGPTWGREVERDIRAKLRVLMRDHDCGEEEAARIFLASKPGWYRQTPEGEFLISLLGDRS